MDIEAEAERLYMQIPIKSVWRERALAQEQLPAAPAALQVEALASPPNQDEQIGLF